MGDLLGCLCQAVVLPPKRKRTQRTPDPFSKEDLDAFINAAWEKLPAPYPLILETIGMTGMRLGECLAMKRDHLDASNSQYMVSETIRRNHYGLPKTGKRLVDVPKEVVEKLVRNANGLRAKALAEGGETSYFFPGITHRLVQGAMKRACHAARLRVRHPHDLRHSYASILLSQGVSVMYVKKQLGHHSITMTVDIYGHWIPGEQKLELGRLLRGETASPIMLRRVK